MTRDNFESPDMPEIRLRVRAIQPGAHINEPLMLVYNLGVKEAIRKQGEILPSRGQAADLLVKRGEKRT